jgi:hypothetical protein
MTRLALIGAAAAIAMCVRAAAFVALVYRFPVPFGGYAFGISGIPLAAMAVLFYGAIFGGFVVVGAVGALLAIHAARRGRSKRFVVMQSVGIALAAALTLAVLELFIGPW